jgi:hypothetical protein
MKVVEDIEGPIEFVRFSGPAIDALDRRKEDNDSPRMTADELNRNFDSVKDELFRNLKQLADQSQLR